MIRVNHHSSAMLIESEKEGEFLFGIYDNTYSPKCFRGAINLIGGNYEEGDNSPFSTLIRELRQELSTDQNYIGREKYNSGRSRRANPEKIKLFASEKDIEKIRQEIISKIIPYKDYLLDFPSFEGRDPFNALTSVFISLIKQDIFEIARENIMLGKSIKNEGQAVISNLEDISRGRFLCAWATGCVLEEYMNLKIPAQYDIRAESIGKPRNSIEEYLPEFNYRRMLI